MALIKYSSIFLLFAVANASASTTLGITVNTTALAADAADQPFYFAFELVDGGGVGNGNNAAVFSNFNFGGGTALFPASIFGNGVAGDATGSVQMTDIDSFEYFEQGFIPGSFLSFNLDLTSNLEDGPIQDELLFWILDNTETPLPTSASDGSDELALFTVNSPGPLISVAHTFGTPAIPAPNVGDSAPEPAAFWLAGLALLFVVLRSGHAKRGAITGIGAGLFLMCFTASAQVGTPVGPTNLPFACTSNGAVTPTVRAEGLTEATGDLVIVCSGGTPVSAGSPLPQFNLTVTLNAPVTNRLVGLGGISDVLLVIDEVGSSLPGAPANQLPCGTPLTGCSITSNGGEPYDGSPGRPNIFAGVITASNAVSFFGIPFQAPGLPGLVRVLRITNLRTNASAVQIQGPTPGAIVASISTTGAALPLSNTTLTTGFVQQGLMYQTRNAADNFPASHADLSTCVAAIPCRSATLRFSENFGTAFKTARQANPQNVPGTIYSGESGLFDPAWASANPVFAAIGIADFGTRLKATFQGIPAGAQLWVPTTIGHATLTSNETGAFNPVAAGQTMDGTPVMQLTASNGAARAIWEVTTTNPNALDTLEFPVWVVFPPLSTPSGTLTINGSFAPNPDDGAFSMPQGNSAQDASFPIPRFTSPIAAPQIAASPNSGLNTGKVSVVLTSNGDSLSSVQAVLRAAGVPDIPGFMTSGPGIKGYTEIAIFELTDVAPGTRDIVVYTSSSEIVLPAAFRITAACSYTLAPSPQSFAIAGGSGQLVVSASPTSCTWNAASDSGWITLGSTTGTTIQNFTVAANTSPDPRTGHINVGGQPLTINQLGQASCTYAISPSSFTFPVAGGTTNVNVTAPSGCAWSVTNPLNWVTAAGSGSGSGTASVTAGTNIGGLLAGTVTIASQTFSVSQSASACGAIDVTSQVKITRGAYVSQPPTFNKFAQTVTVTNTTATSIPGPILLVLDGLPRTGSPCTPGSAICNVYPAPPITHCQSALGSEMVTIYSLGLAPGQSVSTTLSFLPGATAGGSAAGFQYTPRVLSGAPNQ